MSAAVTSASAAAPTMRLRIPPTLSLPRRQANSLSVSGIGYHVSIAGRWWVFEHDLIRKPVPTFRDHARTGLTLPRPSPRTGLMTQMANEDLPPHMRPERSFQGLILAL